MGLITSVIVGIIAGFIAAKVMRSSGGLFTNLVVGILGGMLGRWVAELLNLTYIRPDLLLDQIVVSSCGAILLLAIWRTVKGSKPA
ncbi:GlsB/YeaQ/YmgE family stress response membrane protein [Xanthobacter sp. TB0136]|uniref:GlsB/YeaQ/YmgE family stress response membrane protein n=1 Tax=Xanthobacter sp. TB0136 TaxID=3459177 RepID=UPI0040398C01